MPFAVVAFSKLDPPITATSRVRFAIYAVVVTRILLVPFKQETHSYLQD